MDFEFYIFYDASWFRRNELATGNKTNRVSEIYYLICYIACCCCCGAVVAAVVVVVAVVALLLLLLRVSGW